MVQKNRLLIIGVDKEIHELIKGEFMSLDYEFVCTVYGKEGLNKLKESRFDCIILDEKLVDIQGKDLCQTIRLGDQKTPILYLSYHDDDEKRINAIKIGATDYLVKPLNYTEIYYKIINWVKLIGKSINNISTDKITIGNHTIDFKSFEVKHNNNHKTNRLTQRQIKLLKLLIDKNNEVVSREEILEKIWGYDVFIKTRTIDNVILSLRKIFEVDFTPNTYFKSVRGVGYKLTI